jgi:hypothetical protein
LFIQLIFTDVLEFATLGAEHKYEMNDLESLNLLTSIMSAITAVAINTLISFIFHAGQDFYFPHVRLGQLHNLFLKLFYARLYVFKLVKKHGRMESQSRAFFQPEQCFSAILVKYFFLGKTVQFFFQIFASGGVFSSQ